ERFLLPRPLLRALTSDKPVVLLIDEIDRADAEFEAFLLEILSDFQISVPELGTIKARHQPYVLLTSNNTRELSEALKRRCLYLFVDYTSMEQELNIVRLKVPDLNIKLAQQAVQVVHKLRTFDLKKNPSVSETIDWAKALVALNAEHMDEETLNNTLTVLLKHESDVQRARQGMNGRPAASGPTDVDQYNPYSEYRNLPRGKRR
ncbi:MAG TPA: MoxR family ATPase, partial [Anaerolineae bacterium]|nr:MoxR family ATPase [Anaerolineae bacterium]